MNQIRSINSAQTLPAQASATLATNKMIRNTYMLLSMTLLFSALSAAAAVAMKLKSLRLAKA